MMLLAIVLALGASVPLASGNTVTASATATNTTSVSSMNETSTARATASATVDVSMGSSPSNACSAPIEVGRCRAAVPRWAFSAEDGRCTRFTYGGCGGNDNNFGSRRLCEAECGKPEPEPEPNPVCELTPAVVGRCRAAFRRWTYRAKSRQCESFIYGGCGGNDNNFESEAECEAACEVAPPPADVCELDIVPGPCKALFPSWGFDGEHCVEFNYGGCQGNANRFETEEECEAACEAAPPPPDVCELDIVVGPCEALIPSWGFDGDHCVEFNYGGCEGNGNRFETEEECEAACEAAPPPTDVCELDIVVGPCEAAIKSWGFDGDHCVEFLYGGCGGNGNRFETEEECEAACEVEPAPAPAPTPGPDPDICELDIVPGPCRAFIPSWGFDGKQCVEFVYGGCGGNGNRFETQADCEAACEPAGTCQLPLEPGNCRAAIPRWGFDGRNCVEFTYGGCGGNGNRFETQEECEAACAEDICALPTFPPDLLIRCLAIIPAWTFRDGECTAFTYGGCGATANLFFSEEECLALCGPAAEPAPRVSANTTATAKATVTADPPTRARKARTD